jgi:hypothetical protein
MADFAKSEEFFGGSAQLGLWLGVIGTSKMNPQQPIYPSQRGFLLFRVRFLSCNAIHEAS